MKKALKIIIPIILIAAVITTFVFVRKYMNRTIYNDTIVYGNTAGNFYNYGLFCEANGLVYFSNPYDDYKLYQMNPDGTQSKQLSDDTACFINADANYIYYARAGKAPSIDFSFLQINTNSLCRLPVKGGNNPLILDDAPVLYATLIQNTIYYIHYDTKTASTLYKIGIDGENAKRVSTEPLLLSPGQEGTLCYAGVQLDHNIHLWNPQTDMGTQVYEGICYMPIDSGNYIYFLDCQDNYTLSRYDKASGSVTKLTDCRVDCYNLTDQYAYYQKNDAENPALCRISLDGSSGEEIVMQGNFAEINTTSQYVYFREFSGLRSFFQTPANGSIAVTGFTVQE